jgi:hypothetical protein
MALKNDNRDKYTYRAEEDAEYLGLCAELPSFSWLAQTSEAALKGVRLFKRSLWICVIMMSRFLNHLPPNTLAVSL